MKAILLAGLLALAVTPALAHSGLDTTTPENGAVLAEAPPHIVLTFAKRIRLTRVRLGAVTVTGWCQLRVASSFLL